MNFTKLLYLLIGAIVLLFSPMQLIAADINWTPVQTNYSVYVGFPSGYVLSSDISTSMGVDASDFLTYATGTPGDMEVIVDGTGTAGDNNARDLFADAYIDHTGTWSGAAGITTSASQTWSFSVDYDTPIEVSYSLDGLLDFAGAFADVPYSELTQGNPIYAEFSIYRTGPFTDFIYSKDFTYPIEGDAGTTTINEYGSFVFDYEVNPTWTYEIDMSLYANAGFLSNWPFNIGEPTTVHSSIDTFQVNLSVVPEPVSSTLFIIGGATLGFRCFRKKFKK